MLFRSEQCIDIIFPYNIYLNINKRLKTEEDKDKLDQVYKELFDESKDKINVLKKYFKFTKDLTLSNCGIAYMKGTCKTVSNHIRKKLGKVEAYEVNEVLVCREYLRLNVGTFSTNYRYEILEKFDNSLTIQHINTGEIYIVPISIIEKSFIHNYCGTCHSKQGATIKENITIYDWNFFYATQEWLWTSITRATYLDNVYFYDYDESTLKNDLVREYFRRKVKNYMKQDVERTKKAISEEIKNNYINHLWFEKYINGSCPCCNNQFYLDFNDGSITSNISADRVNCDLYHTVDNIRPTCYRCNAIQGKRNILK